MNRELKTIPFFLLRLILLLTAPISQAQSPNCQGQECKFASSCYQCVAHLGFKCSVDIDNCRRCWSAVCQGPDPLVVAPFLDGTRFDADASSAKSGFKTSPERPACIVSKTGKEIATSAFNSKAGETNVSIFVDSESPAIIKKATFGADTILEGAQLLNLSQREIVGYQIGWLVVSKKQSPKIVLGMQMNVPMGIAPGNLEDVPAQNVPGKLLGGDNGEIEFFVASVLYRDGDSWRLQTDKLKAEVSDTLSRLKAESSTN